jgi:hypothetical protein
MRKNFKGNTYYLSNFSLKYKPVLEMRLEVESTLLTLLEDIVLDDVV